MADVFFTEDDFLIREDIAERLRKAGHNVVEAGSVAEAKALYAGNEILLTDWRLPDGEGRDVIKHAVAINPNVRVIVMTCSNVKAEDLRAEFPNTKIDVIDKNTSRLFALLPPARDDRSLVAGHKREVALHH